MMRVSYSLPIRERLKPLPLCSQVGWVEEERQHLPYPSALLNLFNHQQKGHPGTRALQERRWGTLEGIALSLHDTSANRSQSHLQIKCINFVQFRADRRRFTVRMVSDLFILLLVKPPLRRSLGCFFSAEAAKHLLTMGPSADSKRPLPHWDFSHSHLSLLTGSKWLMRQEDLIPF